MITEKQVKELVNKLIEVRTEPVYTNDGIMGDVMKEINIGLESARQGAYDIAIMWVKHRLLNELDAHDKELEPYEL